MFELGAGNRYKMQQLQQKDWCEQQIAEKQSKKKLEQDINNLFDQQTIEFNNILKQTQDEHNKQRRQNEIDTDNINQIQNAEKKEREKQQRELWGQQEMHELEFTNNHDFMTENPQTEVSMLAPHRVKPYHFKGLNQGQIDQINLERKMQVREAEMMKEQKKKEDQLYAMQLEKIRREQILNDRKMKKNLRSVEEDHFMKQTMQAADSKAKWVDPYHEKDMEHKHVGQDKL